MKHLWLRRDQGPGTRPRHTLIISVITAILNVTKCKCAVGRYPGLAGFWLLVRGGAVSRALTVGFLVCGRSMARMFSVRLSGP